MIDSLLIRIQIKNRTVNELNCTCRDKKENLKTANQILLDMLTGRNYC